MKKVPFGELAFVLGVVFTCMGVALMVSSDLGLSMVAAPAYILGEKFAFLTTGMAEWGIQGTLFILGCVLMRRFSFPLLLSLAVAALNAAVLDVMLTIFAGVSAASFMGQLFLYLLGLLSLSLGIAFAFRSYLPCQVHEMFVKVVSEHFGWNRDKCKIAYDWIFLALALTLSLCFFRRLVGIGIGTVIGTIGNGPLIALWGKGLDKVFNFAPALKKPGARQ